jgi:ribosomal protein S18 acetylase RimI-like enzyme
MVAIFVLRAYNLEMNIRYGTTDDANMLAEFGAKAFYDSFAKDNSEENMRLHLKRTYSPEIQLSELTNPDAIFLIAEIEGEAAGYVKINLNNRDNSVKGIKTVEIERIYAAQEQIGKGIGKSLMQASIQEARRRGYDSLWLGVWEENRRAIEFYKKWGFKEVGTHVFMLGDDQQRDYIMELRLE